MAGTWRQVPRREEKVRTGVGDTKVLGWAAGALLLLAALEQRCHLLQSEGRPWGPRGRGSREGAGRELGRFGDALIKPRVHFPAQLSTALCASQE